MNPTVSRLLFGTRAATQSRVEAENSHIAVVTSSLAIPFTIIDSVNAVASQKAGVTGVDLDSIFEAVKNKLRAKCVALGGDAVISCHFNERSAHSGGLSPSQVIEMWAYGTAIKIREDNAQD